MTDNETKNDTPSSPNSIREKLMQKLATKSKTVNWFSIVDIPVECYKVHQMVESC